MQHKLSYQIANINNKKPHTVEVITNTHIELAESILDMERDCGAICFNVKITHGSFDDSRAKDQKQVIKQMARWCAILPDAIHIK